MVKFSKMCLEENPMSEKYYFIVNVTSRSGKAKAMWQEVEAAIKDKGIDYTAYVTEREGHAKELAAGICEAANENNKISLIVLGGDGTANEVLDGMCNFEHVRFGYIPSGSGNDLARGMGINGTALENLDRVLDCKQAVPMDLGEVTYKLDGKEHTRKFAISSGIGVDADVCKQALTSKLKGFLNSIGLGSLTYILLTIKAFFTMPSTEAEISFDGGPIRKIKRVIFIVAMNHKCEGGGVKMAPDASATDGKLSVLLAHGVSRFRAFFLLPFVQAGKHLKFKAFEIVECVSYELKTHDPSVLHFDGEYGGEPKELSVRCLPGMLNTLV